MMLQILILPTRYQIGNSTSSVQYTNIKPITNLYLDLSAIYKAETETDNTLRRKFRDCLSIMDPIAQHIEEFQSVLQGRFSASIEGCPI